MTLTLKTKSAADSIKAPPQVDRRGDISIPLQASNGRLRIVRGDDLSIQTIATALGEGDHINAFRLDEALGASMIFENVEGEKRSTILAKVRAIFDEFERQNRFRLIPESVRFDSEVGEQEIRLLLMFYDLESDAAISTAIDF